MRNARRVVGGLAVLVLLASAEEASATGRGWLEKLSGPGPFEGIESPTLPIWCFSPKDDDGRSTFDFEAKGLGCSNYQNAPDRTVLISFTYSDLESQDNPLEYDPADTRDKTVDLKSWAFSAGTLHHPRCPISPPNRLFVDLGTED